jgi:hypothetical protein
MYWVVTDVLFHGTGNSAQLCKNFGMSGGGVETPSNPLGTPLGGYRKEQKKINLGK